MKPEEAESLARRLAEKYSFTYEPIAGADAITHTFYRSPAPNGLRYYCQYSAQYKSWSIYTARGPELANPRLQAYRQQESEAIQFTIALMHYRARMP